MGGLGWGEGRGGDRTYLMTSSATGQPAGRQKHVALNPGWNWAALEAISDDAGEDEESTHSRKPPLWSVLIGGLGGLIY